jgi:endonuclease/exonuclease/phosphatase family metal-dependent hydrolase
VPLVVRTWNVCHGRTHPPGRRTHLRQMVELVTADGPDLVALQEVPVWALGRLERWSGMAACWVVTVPALLFGPLARLVTEIDAARLGSAVTGQANVVLLAPRLRAGKQRLLQLNDVGRWEWLRLGRQQRWCQAVRVEGHGEAFTLVNLHATNDPRLAAGEVARAVEFVAGAERVVLCGDVNAPRHPVEGFTPPIAGIDQILVRGLELVEPAHAWDRGRRTLGGRLLSDHAPVEAVAA